MKKFFLFAAAALLIGTAAQSQDVKKQQGGEQNLEFLFAPLGGTPIGINGIKYRKFTSATTAWRATVFLGFNTSSDKRLEGFGDDETELKNTNSSFDIVVAPGIESHFAGTDALSPYVGAEATLGFSKTTAAQEVKPMDDIITNKQKNGTLSVGVNGFAGMDWYFAHRIYLGAEMGFGIQFTTDMDTKYESDAEGAEDYSEPNGSSLSVGPNVVGKLRLGFLF